MTTAVTRRRFVVLAGGAAAFVASPVRAATYPSRTIVLVVPYSTGGGADSIARVIAPKLASILKGSVVVENKPGASAIIGSEFVAHAEPDGYTLLLTQDEIAINPAIYQNLPYNTVQDFAPIARLVSFPSFLAVKADSPIKSVHDLVAYTRSHPDKANFSSSGSTFWLLNALFAQKTGVKLTRVTYKGGGAMVLAVVTGEVLYTFAGAGPISGPAQAGTIRILATTGEHRQSGFPDVPTMAEAGVPGIEIESWSGLWAPAKTPPAIIEALTNAVLKALAMPDVKAQMQKLQVAIAGDTPSAFKRSVISEIALWTQVAKRAHITATL